MRATAQPQPAATRVPGGPAPVSRAGPRDCVAKVVPLEPGLYAFSLAGHRSGRVPIPGLPLPAVHLCPAPDGDNAVEIVGESGRDGSWLGGGRSVLFVRARADGNALITAYLPRQPQPALQLEIRRVNPDAAWAGSGAARVAPLPLLATIRLGGTEAAQVPDPVNFDIVAYIRGRGDVRFAGGEVAGSPGSGSWIEAFMLASSDATAAEAIEYKGLSAGGTETPWLGCGSVCGTTGSGIPLLGFAIRQKAAAAGARFDCEYTGHFQSGATSGPLRNGAPCRSMREEDPLEAIRLRVTLRPGRQQAAAPTD